MSMDIENLISDALSQPVPVIAYYLSRRLSLLHPDKAILEGGAPAFNIEAYAAAGLSALTERAVPHRQRLSHWAGHEHGHVDRPHQSLFEAVWQGEQLQVLVMHWNDGISPPYHYCIVARTQEVAERFHAAVCAWNTPQPKDYIMVFDVNGWQWDEALFAAIQNATLDNLVLRGTLKRDIVNDLTRFFTARETYREYGVPWKRGILFVGPAGNGKTHAVKALTNSLGQTCLYVKTFGLRGGPDEFGIRAIFQQARISAPCILVLEDLDSLITPHNRSYFLNELDGFAGNEGIVTLATTNHPERLDPAILDRPSRFDRKYPFDLPALEERQTYIQQWNDSLKPALRLSPEGVVLLTGQTEGFSFAYIKELFLSSMMQWIARAEIGTMDQVMAAQAEMLRSQMASVIDLPSDPGFAMQAGPHGPAFGRHRRPGPTLPPSPVDPGDIPL